MPLPSGLCSLAASSLVLVNPGSVSPSTVADDGYNMTFRLQVVKETLNLMCLHDVAMRRGSLVSQGVGGEPQGDSCPNMRSPVVHVPRPALRALLVFREA